MAVVGIAMAVWFERYRAAGSARRMTQMMRRCGLGAGAGRDPQTEAVMRAVRRRCKRCAIEGVCERWLAGELTGNNAFCPNAATFRMLASRARGGT